MGGCLGDGLRSVEPAPRAGAERTEAAGRAADIGPPYLGACIAPDCPRQGLRVKSVPNINRIVFVLACAPFAWGCMSSLAGLQSDGNYVLERSEQSASCEVLYKNIWGRIELIKALPAQAKKEREQPPPTASLLFGRLFSGPSGLTAIQDYNRERAHALALQRVMNEKKCVTIELERELSEVDAEMAKVRSN